MFYAYDALGTGLDRLPASACTASHGAARTRRRLHRDQGSYTVLHGYAAWELLPSTTLQVNVGQPDQREIHQYPALQRLLRRTAPCHRLARLEVLIRQALRFRLTQPGGRAANSWMRGRNIDDLYQHQREV